MKIVRTLLFYFVVFFNSFQLSLQIGNRTHHFDNINQNLPITQHAPQQNVAVPQNDAVHQNVNVHQNRHAPQQNGSINQNGNVHQNPHAPQQNGGVYQNVDVHQQQEHAQQTIAAGQAPRHGQIRQGFSRRNISRSFQPIHPRDRPYQHE